MVEKLTGKVLVDLIREEVFTPLGIEHASLVWNEDIAQLTATGHGGIAPMSKWRPKEPNTAASLHVNAKNYAKFLIAVLEGNGFSEPTIKEMLRPQVKMPDGGAFMGPGHRDRGDSSRHELRPRRPESRLHKPFRDG